MLLLCFFNDTATTEIYTYLHTLSLHDALPIYDIVGLRRADLELLDLDRAHVLAIGGNDPELHSRNADVEEGHGAAVNDAQPHPLTRIEQELQTLFRSPPISEISIRGARHVQDVGRHHAHARPHPPVLARQRIVVGPGILLVIEVAFALLQLVHDRMRMERGELA